MIYSEVINDMAAATIVNELEEKYEEHFGKIFPLYEYLHITRDDPYDVSFAGAKRFEEFINGRIAENTPVPIPEGYEERLY